MDLLAAAQSGRLRFARLVGDDRVHLEACHGRLLVRPAESRAGLIEVRGVGILRLEHEPVAAVGWVVDLSAHDAERLPTASEAVICGIRLPRLAVAAGVAPLMPTLALLRQSEGDIKAGP
jgi:serine kinase of HPr protein (carbohydrate metabolism regulator)